MYLALHSHCRPSTHHGHFVPVIKRVNGETFAAMMSMEKSPWSMSIWHLSIVEKKKEISSVEKHAGTESENTSLESMSTVPFLLVNESHLALTISIVKTVITALVGELQKKLDAILPNNALALVHNKTLVFWVSPTIFGDFPLKKAWNYVTPLSALI